MPQIWSFGLVAALFTVAFSSFTLAQRANDPAAEAVLGVEARFQPVIAANGMVAAQDKIAAEVGAQILKEGGNAVDAAVATGFALAVTHPQAGNLGGGGFMMIALAEQKKVVAIDFRETAPNAATRDMFLDEKGNVDTLKARFSRASVGVPGSVAGLVMALEKYGTLPLEKVIAPALKLSDEGFPVSRSLAYAMAKAKDRFERDPSSIGYFQKAGGEAYRAGDIFRQPDLAKTLRAIAKQGTRGFYEGEVAERIVGEMRAGGGIITLDDLKSYKPVERAPVRGTYRGYEIASMPPPSSGGAHVIQILNILEAYNLKAMGHNSADAIHRMVEAMRRAYADRAKYLADPDFVKVPLDGIVSKAYAEKLRQTIDPTKATKSSDVSAGNPPGREGEQTTHYSVMDKAGNAVAVTTTLNLAFGSGFSVDGAGFLLNNEMDDFSAKPGAPNAYGLIGDDANAIQPKKRPLSSMAPTIVLKDGVPILATGSPGGSTIITVVMQTLLNVMSYDMNLAEATAAPRVHHQWQPDLIISESGISVDTLRILEGRGFIMPKNTDGSFQHRILGRVNSVMKNGSLFLGTADTRDNDGAAIGF